MHWFAHLAVEIGLELLVEARDVLAEGLELGYDEIVAEDLGDERQVAHDDVLELVVVEVDALERGILAGAVLLQPGHARRQSHVRLEPAIYLCIFRCACGEKGLQEPFR